MVLLENKPLARSTEKVGVCSLVDMLPVARELS